MDRITTAIATLLIANKFPCIIFAIEVSNDCARHFIDDVPTSTIDTFTFVKVHLSLDLFLFHRDAAS